MSNSLEDAAEIFHAKCCEGKKDMREHTIKSLAETLLMISNKKFKKAKILEHEWTNHTITIKDKLGRILIGFQCNEEHMGECLNLVETKIKASCPKSDIIFHFTGYDKDGNFIEDGGTKPLIDKLFTTSRSKKISK